MACDRLRALWCAGGDTFSCQNQVRTLIETIIRAPGDGFVTWNSSRDSSCNLTFLSRHATQIRTVWAASHFDRNTGATLPRGNEVEVVLNLYPCHMIHGKVDSVI